MQYEQPDDHCRELRNVQRDDSTADAQRAHRDRYLCRSYHADGSMDISVSLPREKGELVMKALEKALAEVEQQEREQEQEALQTRQADALVQVAQSFLVGGADKKSCTADNYQVMVHVDEAALRGEPTQDSKSDLPIETVRRLCCDSAIVAVKEDGKGNPLQLSRKHRVVQPALKRALMARDKCCRFPGCTHEKWLDAHHVVHWADGGETNLENTVLLCSKHHRLLHEGAFSINPGHDGAFQFRRGR